MHNTGNNSSDTEIIKTEAIKRFDDNPDIAVNDKAVEVATEITNLAANNVKKATNRDVNEAGDKADAFYYDGVLYLQIDGEHDIRTLRDHEVTHHHEVAAFRSTIENKTEAKEEVTTNASGKANDKLGVYKAKTNTGPKFYLFPGKVFPKGSQASEETIIWARKTNVKARVRNVFTCYGVPYLVEKFDDMDMGYLIVKELSDGELNEWKEYKNYEDDELENGENKREKQNEEIQADEEDRERGGGFSRGANDDYSTDKHHGKIANARGMGELSHNQRVSGSFRSASDERSVGDRPRRASYDVRKKAEAAYADSDIRDSEGKLKLLYYVPTRKNRKQPYLAIGQYCLKMKITLKNELISKGLKEYIQYLPTGVDCLILVTKHV